MHARYAIIVCAGIALYASGCGYTTRSLLAPDYKAVCVENFVNKINMSAETDDDRMYKGYRHALESDITKAVIDRFLYDGNLKVSDAKDAQLILKGELIDFKKEPLRYDANDNLEEYRIRLVVRLEMKDTKSGAVLWKEDQFSGESTYRTSGSLAKSESAAISDAVSDLARRIVEKTVEGW